MVIVGALKSVAYLAIAIPVWLTQARAATITVYPGDGETSIITVVGPLEQADVKAFLNAALPLDTSVVSLRSKGGKLGVAIEIGKVIRLKGFSTLVVDTECLSACALIWLAGERRYLQSSARIGFHAAAERHRKP